MNILAARYVITNSKEQPVVENGAVAYEDSLIVEVADSAYLKNKFPNAKFEKAEGASVLLPSLINPHIHLEFSLNKSSFAYGSFAGWLKSVLQNKPVFGERLEGAMERELQEIKLSGVGALGAVSSFGDDIEVLAASKLKVAIFNETLGVSEARLSESKERFLQRFEKSEKFASRLLTPAISLHSTYSSSKKLMEFAVDFAKQNNLLISSHFMESQEEREWLQEDKGALGSALKETFGVQKSSVSAMEFLDLFDGAKAIFVHCTHANKEELSRIAKMGAHIACCPVSNRLLGLKPFDIELANSLGAKYALATDGLSSNFSLNIWNELRTALFAYPHIEPNLLAKELLKSVTANAADALGLNSGRLKAKTCADMALITLPDEARANSVELSAVLHTNRADRLIINGVDTI